MTFYKTMLHTAQSVQCAALQHSTLEYGLPVWNASKVSDIETLENVQRYFTKRISSCRGLDYWQRLHKLKLMSLQRRRERYMMIHVWKLLHDKAPNDIGMRFHENMRLGIKVRVPQFNNRAQKSVSSHYDNSFGIKALEHTT